MRRLLSTTLLILTAVTVLPGLAHESNSCVWVDGASTPVCHHFFEGKRIELPVREVLDGIDKDCEQLVIRVLQRQGTLLAQLGEPLEFDADNCSTMTSIALDLPDVRWETDIFVQLSFINLHSGQADKEIGAARIALRVYPDTLLDPLVRFAEQQPLIVFDDDARLTDFFDHHQIDYIREVEAISGKPIGLLVQPKEPERMLEDRGIDTAIIFQEKIVDLPQVRVVSMHGQTRVYVEMPVLHQLHNNPLAQKALLNIINLATNQYSTDRG